MYCGGNKLNEIKLQTRRRLYCFSKLKNKIIMKKIECSIFEVYELIVVIKRGRFDFILRPHSVSKNGRLGVTRASGKFSINLIYSFFLYKFSILHFYMIFYIEVYS